MTKKNTLLLFFPSIVCIGDLSWSTIISCCVTWIRLHYIKPWTRFVSLIFISNGGEDRNSHDPTPLHIIKLGLSVRLVTVDWEAACWKVTYCTFKTSVCWISRPLWSQCLVCAFWATVETWHCNMADFMAEMAYSQFLMLNYLIH